MRKLSFVLFSITLILLSSCNAAEESVSKPVEAYLQAIVDQDVDRISTLVCSDWADSALLELDAFMGVEAALEDVSCTESDVGDNQATVTCSGNIVATYNNEQQQFSLSGRVYQLVREGGEWLVCGYQ